MDDIGVPRELAHSVRECAGELATRPPVPVDPCVPRRGRLDPDDLDLQAGRHRPRHGEVSLGRDRAHVQAVAGEAAEHAERGLAGCAALGEGRLRQDDQHAH